MPLDLTAEAPDARVQRLNRAAEGKSPQEILALALHEPGVGPLALVSSFGAEAAVLLHMVSEVAPGLPVLFLDTEMLFPETLAYQRDLSAKLGLMDVQVLTPDRDALLIEDNENLLHLYDKNACCALRKTRPLAEALDGFGGWISGRKRYHGGKRTTLPFFELDAKGRLKVNPVAAMDGATIAGYFSEHALPRHPLVSKGYSSLGCAPCTSPVGFGEDARAGRWRGEDRSECGIHFGPNGVTRAGEKSTDFSEPEFVTNSATATETSQRKAS